MSIFYNGMEDKISNIVEDRELKQITLNTLQQIADTIGVTLGPYGYNVLVHNPQVGHFSTKDGFTVMKNTNFPGDISNTIHSLITSVSAKLVEKVGDASTTSVLVSVKLYTLLLDFIDNNNMRPKQLMDMLDAIKQGAIEYIDKTSIKVSPDLKELKDIATVSLNNDQKLGDLVSEAYKGIGGEGFIYVKIGRGENTTLSRVNGFQIDSGYPDPIMINNPELKESTFENPLVLMFDAGLHDEKWVTILNAILSFSITNKRNVVLVTSSYGKLIQNWFSNYTATCKEKQIPISLSILTMPNTTDNQFAAFEDLALKLGCKIINTIDKEENTIDFKNIRENSIEDTTSPKGINHYAGSCDKIVSTDKTSTFINSHGDKDVIKSRILDITTKLEDMATEDVLLSEKYRLRKRLAVLNDCLTTISVGGESEQDKIAKKALIDDAVGACKATIQHGYVQGNNITLMKFLYSRLTVLDPEKDKVEFDLTRLLFMAMYEPYRKVRENGKIKCSEIYTFEDIKEFVEKTTENFTHNINIIDGSDLQVISPASTDTEIIKTVTNMIGLLITSKVALTKETKSCYNDTGVSAQ